MFGFCVPQSNSTDCTPSIGRRDRGAGQGMLESSWGLYLDVYVVPWLVHNGVFVASMSRRVLICEKSARRPERPANQLSQLRGERRCCASASKEERSMRLASEWAFAPSLFMV